MRGVRRIAVAAVASAAVACSAAGQARAPVGPVAGVPSPGCGRAAPAPPGQDRGYTIPIDPALAGGASERTALVHVPAGYRAGVPAPLLMEFHGAAPDATAGGYEQASPLHQLSDRDGFLDVFPQGLRAPNGNLGWNAYGPVYVKVAEIPFVDKLLAAVESDFCVNPARVYASGVSNGGNMVNYVACRDAGRFAAVAPVVGPMFGQDDGPCRPSRPVPIVDLHSFNDPGVPYDGHPGPPDYQFPLPSVPAWLDGWAALDGCQPAPPARTAADAQVRTWGSCRQGARIVAYATQAGHAWPGTLEGRPAAEVVWAFLSSFSLRSGNGY